MRTLAMRFRFKSNSPKRAEDLQKKFFVTRQSSFAPTALEFLLINGVNFQLDVRMLSALYSTWTVRAFGTGKSFGKSG